MAPFLLQVHTLDYFWHSFSIPQSSIFHSSLLFRNQQHGRLFFFFALFSEKKINVCEEDKERETERIIKCNI